MKDSTNLLNRIEECRKFCTEVSKTAGVTKGLKMLSDTNKDSEARYYFKLLLQSQFKQLMIGLNILTEDNSSQLRIEQIIKDFEKQYGGRLKELGLSEDIEKEKKYHQELKPAIIKWNKIRNEYSAHLDIRKVPNWNLDIEDISIFIEVIIKILNTLLRTMATPTFYPKHTNSISYTVTTAINLEEESFEAIKNNLKWSSN